MPNDVSSPEDSPWSKATAYSPRTAAGVIECELDQLGELTGRMAEEVHRSRLDQDALRDAVESLLEMYKTVHPDAALVLARERARRDDLEACCPQKPEHPLVPLASMWRWCAKPPGGRNHRLVAQVSRLRRRGSLR